MSTQLIQDHGFTPETWPHGYTPNAREIAGEHGAGLDLTPSCALSGDLTARLATIAMIRIHFDNFTDGRGFTLARQLRLMGYTGRLRAFGPLIPDQYAMARRAGFDEVEIPAPHAKRHQEAHWQFRADWSAHDFQARLRDAA